MIKRILNKIKCWFDVVMRQEVLFYVFLIVLMLPNFLLAITEPLSPLERICSIVFPLSCYYLIFSLSRRLGWSVWLLCPMSLLAGFQVVLLYIYGKSVVATDMFLNMVTTDANESKELLSSIITILAVAVFLYVTPMILATISLIKKQKLKKRFVRQNRNIAIAVAFIGVSLLGLCYAVSDAYSVKTGVYPINACYNMYKAVSRHDMLQNYKSTSSDFKYNASSSHSAKQREIYVVVIGETSRACNWQLYGYERETNPLLKQIDDLIVFDNVLTESNITHKTVPMLISSASAIDYDKIYYQKSLITAFKEAGFKTAFFSNQSHTETLIDFFALEADRYEYLRDRSNESGFNPLDDEFVNIVQDVVNEGAMKQLIVLHSYGSHFNYAARYPSEMAYFKPDSPSTPEKEFLPQLRNAYDNTIRYTDKILYDIIKTLDNVDNAHTSLLYVSDHGEELFDDEREVIFHSSTTPSYYQLHVPMIMWFSQEYREAYPNIPLTLISNCKEQVSSSASFFHSILNIAGIETRYRNDTYSLASKSFIERERVYLNDHYQGVPLKSIDMREADHALIEKLQKL